MSASLETRVELMFGGRCHRPPNDVEYASGRIVVLGEHLDHQGGPVLVAPTPEGVACAWGVRPDSRVVVWGMNAREKDSFHHDRVVKSGRAWADLARGAYAHVAEGRPRMPGLDLMVQGDLPIGEGLASSAAYLVVILRAIYEAIGQYRSKWELAEDVPKIEREWLGVHSGPMDPYVVAALRDDQWLHLDCGELSHTKLTVPAGIALASEDTGVTRELRTTPYNERVQELADAWAALEAAGAPGSRLVDLDVETFERLAPALPAVLQRRARHVVTEVQRVADAVQALEAGDAARLGALMAQGHQSLSQDFESTTPEIDARVAERIDEPDVLGARLQGAGWGGRLAVLRRSD